MGSLRIGPVHVASLLFGEEIRKAYFVMISVCVFRRRLVSTNAEHSTGLKYQ